MAIDSAVTSAVVTSTACCNTILVRTSAASVKENEVMRGFLSISSTTRPTSELRIDIAVYANGSNNALTTIPVFPVSYTVSGMAVSTTAVTAKSQEGVSLTSSLLALAAGTYRYEVSLSGAAASQYEVVYTSATQAVTVVSSNVPLPAPVLKTATFSNDGSYVAVTFDTATDRGQLPSRFTCSSLFEFSCAATSSCLWTSSSTVSAFVDPSLGCVAVDSPVTIADSTIQLKAQCRTSNCDTSTWLSASPAVRILITSSTNAVSPKVSISAPSSIGECDALVLDLSGSSGNGGRDWIRAVVTVETTATANVTELSRFLSDTYKTSPPTPIPVGLLHKGSVYTFNIELCNFLHKCGTASKRVAVQTLVVPSVNLPGSSLRTVTRSSSLVIGSDAYYTTCSRASTRAGLSYRWVVSHGGVEQTSLFTRSKDPSVLLLPPHTLQANTLYEITLRVTKLDNLQSAATSVQVLVTPGQLRASVLLGTDRTVRLGESIRIDASSSSDDDVAGLTGAKAGLVFTWTCTQTAPVFSSTCNVVLTTTSTLTELSSGIFLATAVGSVGCAADLVVTVQDSTRSRTATTTVSVTVTPSLAPVVTLTSNVPSTGVFNGNDELQLTATVTLPPGLNGSVVWDVDTLSYSSFSLFSATKAPITRTIGAASLPNPTAVYLVLRSMSLPGRQTLTFSFTATTYGVAQSVTAAVSVTVNAPPLPGKFVVNPRNGTEIEDIFTFAASQWFD